MMTREQLTAVWQDWKNNFLTIGGFADYYGLYDEEAEILINLARRVADKPHPEA
jgi:hypothetical protein